MVGMFPETLPSLLTLSSGPRTHFTNTGRKAISPPPPGKKEEGKTAVLTHPHPVTGSNTLEAGEWAKGFRQHSCLQKQQQRKAGRQGRRCCFLSVRLTAHRSFPNPVANSMGSVIPVGTRTPPLHRANSQASSLTT